MPRCNYCANPAGVWYVSGSWVASRGRRKLVRVTRAACEEHEKGPGFVGLLSMRKASEPLQRAARAKVGRS